MLRWLRAGAVALAVLALAASAVQVSREGEGEGRTGPAASGTAPDPLAAELERCNAVTPVSGRDQACERAWSENRRRFLGARAQTPDVLEPADAARPTTPAGQP